MTRLGRPRIVPTLRTATPHTVTQSVQDFKLLQFSSAHAHLRNSPSSFSPRSDCLHIDSRRTAVVRVLSLLSVFVAFAREATDAVRAAAKKKTVRLPKRAIFRV